MKKKQLLMTAILVILVIILIFSQRFFNDNFKQVALLDNDISSLEEFSMKDQGYSYSIPKKKRITHINFIKQSLIAKKKI